MYDNDVLQAYNLTLNQKTKIIENYKVLYNLYIIKNKVVPKKDQWSDVRKNNMIIYYIEDYTNKLNLSINIQFIKKNIN